MKSYGTLRKRSEFQRVFRLGSRLMSGELTVLAHRRHDGPPRVGFVTTRNVGGAVMRNRTKRRLREAARQVELTEGYDYVIIASAETADLSFAELTSCLDSALKAAP